MNAQMLEILIGKYIDSEITPAEQQLLDHELAANPKAKLLLDDYQQLDRLSRQAVDSRVAQSGRSFDAIFSSALDQYRPKSRLKKWLASPWLRLPAAAAAGFIIGLFSLHLHLYMNIMPSQDMMLQKQNQKEIAVIQDPDRSNDTVALQPIQQHNVLPNKHPGRTDWYTFTDPSGSRWLLETQRAGEYDLAGYTDDL